MTEDVPVRSFMPGDEVQMEVEFFTRARVTSVEAVFVRRDQRLVLAGELSSFERTNEGRINRVYLYQDDELSSSPLDSGSYPMADMVVTTHNGQRFKVQPLPSVVIRIEDESPGEVPRITGLRFVEEWE